MYRFNLKTIVPLIVAVAVHAPFLFADEPVGGTEIPEIVITADPLSEVDAHLVQPVQVLTKEELKTRSIRNIGETVADELGVTSSDFGTGAGRPIIRGLGGSRVSVLENGISTMDVASISADHAVPAEPVFARQVEIFRGPATLLYGSGASGGVVNIVNDRILEYVPESLEGDLLVEYETVSDGMTGAGSVNIGTGNFAIHIDGMLRDTDDYDIPGFAESEPDEHDDGDDSGQGVFENSSIETENVAGGLSWVGDRGFVGFAVSRLDMNYGVPGHHHEEEHGEEGEEENHHEEEEDHHEEEEDHHHEEAEEGGARTDMKQTRYDFKAAVNRPFAGLRRIKTRLAYNDYEHVELEPSGEVGTAFDNEEVEGRIEFIHDPIGSWDGAFGIQYRDKDFAAVGEESFVAPSELESIGVFVLEKGDFGPWHVDLGARYEHQDTSTASGEEAKHDLFSVSGGVSWDYAQDYQLGFAVTHAQRAPAIEELYSNGPHLATTTFEVGNPNLEKEKSINIDIYLRKTTGKFTFTANFFYNRIDDFIFLQEQDLNGDGFADRVEEDFDGDPANILPSDEDEEPLLVFQTQDDADFMGFEMEGIARVLDGDRGALDVRLWADYVEGKRSNDIHLPRITPWRFGAGLNYSRGSWYAFLNYIRVNKQDDTAPLETETGGYDTLNIYASYTFKLGESDMTLFVSGDNLLDEEIRRHTSFVKEQAPLPGRSGIFGIRVSL